MKAMSMSLMPPQSRPARAFRSAGLLVCLSLAVTGGELRPGVKPVSLAGAAAERINALAGLPGGGVIAGGTKRAFVVAVDGAGREIFRRLLSDGERDEVLFLATDAAGNSYAAVSAYSPWGEHSFLLKLGLEGEAVARTSLAAAPTALAAGGEGAVFLGQGEQIVRLEPEGAAWREAWRAQAPGTVLALAADAEGALYAGGRRDAREGGRAYVAKLAPAGSGWAWALDLPGSSGQDAVRAIAVDSARSAWVAGVTRSIDLAAGVPEARLAGSSDGFIAKVRADGAGLEWASYVGGSGPDAASAIVLTADGRAVATGWTGSGDFAGMAAWEWKGSEDGFIVEYDEAGRVLQAAMAGIDGAGRLSAAVFDPDGRLWVGGWGGTAGKQGYLAVIEAAGPIEAPRTERRPKLAAATTYSISGNAGVAGATVALSGTQSGSVDADPSGNYTFPNLAAGGDYTVTPSKANYVFNPPARTFTNLSANQTGVDFTASPAPDLSVAKTLSSSFVIGSTGAYTLTVRNVGGGATIGTVSVTDVLPAGLTYSNAAGTGWNCQIAVQTVSCLNPGPINAGAESSIALTVSVGAAAYPGVNNTATVTTPGDGNAANNSSTVFTPVRPTPLMSASLDVNLDGKADLLWQHPAAGDVWAWLMNGATMTGYQGLGASADYRVVVTGDFNLDQQTDVILQHPVNGDAWIWYFNQGNYIGYGQISGPHTYRIRAAADLNSDGKLDLIWQHPVNGDVWVWLMNGATPSAYQQVSGPHTYKVMAAGDLNGDGKADLIWQHPTNLDVWAWIMNGTTPTGYAQVAIPNGYDVAGVGDYNADGKLDLLWQHPVNGDVWLWYLNNGAYTGYAQVSGPMTYKAIGWR